ncbi:TPA: AI-2E family transporter YdiK [Salmonella enterica]|nr:AI-2E family transporter YdiK [Salmonella enterica subsp. enterica serovar Panama]EHK0622868.1 AI-2E family transporter YdiK [Salmonella enterica subsp. enterica serovar Panama]EJL0530178.1 AI-2E family transporter YdiK [Salmonella enterica]HAK1705089.1 AI-2E family transporter YdiK [Salmonella enterica]HAK4236938.1 AI-2E family transporter YdiK [Salmonella enterica]
MVNVRQPRDIAQVLLSVLFLAIMIVACLWIVQPFILGFAWAGTIVIATWPVLLKLQKILWGRRSLAVLVMTLLLVLLFVIPVALLVNSIVDGSGPLIHAVTGGDMTLPDLAWLNNIPLVGAKLYAGWHSLLDMGGSAIMAKVRPYIGTTTTWFVGQAAHIGRFMMHCALMLLFSALLYWRGEQVAMGIRHFACRLTAKRGDAAVLLAAQAIRAVALGVVVTALVQAVLGGVGLAISGVPYATLLTVVMILSCLVQLGPLPVLIPAIIWLYWTGDTTWGTVLLVWSAVVGTLDNVIRPVLIRMGADLPLLLILSGVIGGLIAFGMIGLFIGPVLLAVTWRLFSAWVHEVPAPTNEPEEILEELDDIEEANKQS